MDKKELVALLQASAEAKYTYFIKRVVDTEKVWSLYSEGWAMTVDEAGNRLLPFWPKQEFALHAAVDEWHGYKPMNIDLYEFIEDWIPGMSRDEIKPAIFWVNGESITQATSQLLSDLREELEHY